MKDNTYTQTTVSVKRNGKMKQVIRTTVLNGRKNRKGEPYKISETKHIPNIKSNSQ